jgi:16S rRNA (cytosine967-C5)-methyltransferase
MTKPTTLDSGIASRRETIFLLSRWLETYDFPNRMLTAAADRGFIMDLLYGCVRWRRALAWVLQQRVRQMPEGEAEAALLVGAYQVLYMPEIPAYAAVHATVAAAKIGSPRAAGFINAVLRNLERQRSELLAALAQQPLGVRLSHPDLLVTRWIARYGAETTAALCHWNNTPAETVIALLPNQETAMPPPALVPHPAAPAVCFTVPHGTRVEAVPGFAEGRFVVQDPATQAAIELLDIHPGQTVLDACAAPGGKTAQIAARMQGQGRLIAMDKHDDRLVLLRDTLSRTGQSWVEVVAGDAVAPAPTEAPLFDRILLDVPCSNTGVLRRRPDARWRFSVRRQQKLCETQQALLISMLTRLAPGGRLVYSTCSLEPEENQQQIARALAATPAVRLVATTERLPTRDQTDGAFAAALERTP